MIVKAKQLPKGLILVNNSNNKEDIKHNIKTITQTSNSILVPPLSEFIEV